MNKLQLEDQKFIANTYLRFPLVITRGEGCYVYDDQNKKYLDFTSGIGVNAMGYNFKPWVEACAKQLETLSHISNLYYSKPNIEVAKKLCEKTGMKKVFFANSGAEANEGAIKIARKYANLKYNGERNEIITLQNSFHGRTLTTLTATGQDVFHQNFGPFMEGFTYVEPNSIEDLKAKVTNKTLAIMIEVVQGEGGVILLDLNFLKEVQNLCVENDILFIIDEIQTGIGRCGALFSYMNFDLHPDLVTCAKGLGNGLPIGAILIGEKCENVLVYGDHGTTFGGNPVACAGANIILDYMNEELYTSVKSKEALIRQRLSKMKHVKAVNGLGLMLGIELDPAICAKDIVLACIDHQVLFLTAKENLRMLPPLIISEEEINLGMDILANVLNEMETTQ